MFLAICGSESIKRKFPIEICIADITFRIDNRRVSIRAGGRTGTEPHPGAEDRRDKKHKTTGQEPPARPGCTRFDCAARRPTGPRDSLNRESKIGGGLE